MKTQNPFIGRFKGHAGGMIGTKSYDDNVLRAMPIQVANPKTTGQVRQRNFFAKAVRASKELTDAQLKSFYPNKPYKMSRRAAYTKLFLGLAKVQGGVKSIDWTKWQGIGNGNAVTTPIGQMTEADENLVVTCTKEQLGVKSTENPYVYVVIADITEGYVYVIPMGQLGTATSFSFEHGEGVQIGHEYYAYVTCNDSSKSGNKSAFGEAVIKCRK